MITNNESEHPLCRNPCSKRFEELKLSDTTRLFLTICIYPSIQSSTTRNDNDQNYIQHRFLHYMRTLGRYLLARFFVLNRLVFSENLGGVS